MPKFFSPLVLNFLYLPLVLFRLELYSLSCRHLPPFTKPDVLLQLSLFNFTLSKIIHFCKTEIRPIKTNYLTETKQMENLCTYKTQLKATCSNNISIVNIFFNLQTVLVYFSFNYDLYIIRSSNSRSSFK